MRWALPDLGASPTYTWGSTPRERSAPFPCDPYLPEADAVLFRAADVGAPARVLFRWLCQLKVAPYSYDWIDNFGRRSPRWLTPGAEDLKRNQRVMTIFRLVDFEEGRHLTLVMASPWGISAFGSIALSYVVVPVSGASCRLVVKMLVRYPERRPWAWMRWFLPWGDLLMMRKQILTLKRLAEGSLGDAAPAR
jgi:hypothetical protein